MISPYASNKLNIPVKWMLFICYKTVNGDSVLFLANHYQKYIKNVGGLRAQNVVIIQHYKPNLNSTAVIKSFLVLAAHLYCKCKIEIPVIFCCNIWWHFFCCFFSFTFSFLLPFFIFFKKYWPSRCFSSSSPWLSEVSPTWAAGGKVVEVVSYFFLRLSLRIARGFKNNNRTTHGKVMS